MEVRSVTNPGSAQTATPATNQNTPNSAPTNHVSRVRKTRQRPGKVKTTLPIAKNNNEQSDDSVSLVKNGELLVKFGSKSSFHTKLY